MKNITILSQKALGKKLLDIPYDYPHMFSAVFTKKDGTIRHMTCRRGVISRSAGVRDGLGRPYEPSYNFSEHGLLAVFDVNKDPAESHDGRRGSYRSIPADNILQLKLEGHIYRTKSYNQSLQS